MPPKRSKRKATGEGTAKKAKIEAKVTEVPDDGVDAVDGGEYTWGGCVIVGQSLRFERVLSTFKPALV
jgi:hypothetical protein